MANTTLPFLQGDILVINCSVQEDKYEVTLLYPDSPPAASLPKPTEATLSSMIWHGVPEGTNIVLKGFKGELAVEYEPVDEPMRQPTPIGNPAGHTPPTLYYLHSGTQTIVIIMDSDIGFPID